MEGSLKDLSAYRIKQAEEMLEAAEGNLEIKQYKTSLNRSYYAIFHAIRAVNIMDGFDSSKHSGVIAHFNHNYLKDGKIDKSLSKIIKTAYYLREKSDYDDFFIASKADSEKQLLEAKKFVNVIKEFLSEFDGQDLVKN